MTYERKGYRHGAWVISIGESSVTIEADGSRSFPELDRLYVPRVPDPMHWDDNLVELVPDAETQLLCMLEISGNRPECLPDDEAKELAQLIERFGKSRRKYFYFEQRKYWHMGEPHSEDSDKWPNVINRTWVDVRRHAANVKHVWTAEEVELQIRLWEIQLEKSTDRPKLETTP